MTPETSLQSVTVDGALLPRLKAATVGAHARLERTVAVFERVASRSGYSALIARFYGLYEPLEERLAAAVDWTAQRYDFDARRKTPLLARDLLALPRGADRVATAARCEALPDVSSLSRVLGCLYVLEGSTLGGQMIARELQRRHGMTSGSGAAFFSSYGSAVGPQWRAFQAWAETQARAMSDNEQTVIVTAAVKTFDCMQRWLSDERAESEVSSATGERARQIFPGANS